MLHTTINTKSLEQWADDFFEDLSKKSTFNPDIALSMYDEASTDAKATAKGKGFGNQEILEEIYPVLEKIYMKHDLINEIEFARLCKVIVDFYSEGNTKREHEIASIQMATWGMLEECRNKQIINERYPDLEKKCMQVDLLNEQEFKRLRDVEFKFETDKEDIQLRIQQAIWKMLDEYREKQIQNQYFKNQYEVMCEAANKQVTHLLAEYTEALSEYENDDVPASERKLLMTVKAVGEKLNTGENIEGEFPSNMRPLLDQMNAVSRTIDCLKEKEGDKKDGRDYYKTKIVSMQTSLTQVRETKDGNTTDLKTIKKDLSPVTHFFEKAFNVVMLMLNPGYIIDRMEDSKKKRGHMHFWKSIGYDFKVSLKETEKKFDISRPKKCA